VLMLLCTVYFTLTTFTAMAPEHAWPLWDRFVKIVLMSVIVPLVIYGESRTRWLVAVTALSIGFYGFKGGIFTLLHGGVYQVRGPDGSFIGDNNSLGLALVMVIPLLHWLALQESKAWLRRFYLLTMYLNIISAVFTYSRGALLGLAAVLSLMFLKSRKKVVVVLLLVPLAYFGEDLIPHQLYSRAESIDSYQTDSSAMLRLQAWGVAWNLAKERPLRGGGFAFEYIPDARWLSYAPFMVENARNYARAAHSIYFQVLGDHGFVAFGAYLAMLGTMLQALRKVRRRNAGYDPPKWPGTLASALQVSMVGYMVSGAFLSLAYFDLPYLLIAIAAILQRESTVPAVAATQPAIDALERNPPSRTAARPSTRPAAATVPLRRT
jgi:putative inorganic carbon (hco3(-)) transporter